MSTKTTHIVPKHDGWAIVREGSIYKKVRSQIHTPGRLSSPVASHASNQSSEVFSTQKAAINAARRIVHQSPAWQIVIHGRDGSLQWGDVHGLPTIQTPPLKSDLGTKAIKKAISTVIRERLAKIQ